MIDINRLQVICAMAREDAYRTRKDPNLITVTLNRRTCINLFDALRYYMPADGQNRNAFLFEGCRVSWSPMFDEDPIAYAVGYLERAH